MSEKNRGKRLTENSVEDHKLKREGDQIGSSRKPRSTRKPGDGSSDSIGVAGEERRRR